MEVRCDEEGARLRVHQAGQRESGADAVDTHVGGVGHGALSHVAETVDDGAGRDVAVACGVTVHGAHGAREVHHACGHLVDVDLKAQRTHRGPCGANIGGGITVGLKPGIINIVPVTKKQYESNAPWVAINKLRIRIDGCVGESFIRSYAVLAKSNADGDAILSWYGVTKKV